MSRLLSKQVAELEAEIALCDMLHSTQLSENRGKHADKWASICAELDLNPNETQIGQLATAIRDRAGVDLERCWDITDELRDERDRLKAENAALRAGQGTWPEGDDSPAGGQVPRVISADQVRPEQIIAYWQEGVRPNPSGSVAHVRAVELEAEGGYRVTDAEGRFDVLGDEDDDYTIVLLEDAPISDDNDDPAPRLTVHALNTAPVGSVVISGTLVFTKNHDGDWISNDPALGYVPHEIAAITPDANATLTHPEATP